jgi:hypothetical protein
MYARMKTVGLFHSIRRAGRGHLAGSQKQTSPERREATQDGVSGTSATQLCSGFWLPRPIPVAGSGARLAVVGRIWMRGKPRDIREGLTRRPQGWISRCSQAACWSPSLFSLDACRRKPTEVEGYWPDRRKQDQPPQAGWTTIGDLRYPHGR